VADLTVSIAPAQGVKVPPDAGPFFVDIVFTRTVVDASATTGAAPPPKTIQDTVRAILDPQLRAELTLRDVVRDAPIEIAFLAGSGAARLRKTVTAGAAADLSVPLVAADVSAIAAADPQPTPSTPQFYRQARFVPVSDQPYPFEASTLQIAIVKTAGSGWSALGLDTLLHADAAITTSVPWTPDFLQLSARVAWATFHLAVDGQFTFTGDLKSGDAWIWWLSGPSPAIGVVLDDLSVPRLFRIAVPLPPTAVAPAPPEDDHDHPSVPADVTETEVVNNPQV
jgi:hypothetical protein